MATAVTVLSYAACGTCKKALKWLDEKGVTYEVRPIVDKPPTAAELRAWLPASGVSVRKWLNTSGQSYRALGKEKVDAASDAQVEAWLTKDGKLVRRPVVVVQGAAGTPLRVLVGFRPEAFAEALGA
jgi:arsenate reductase (glutaredoxin)